MTLIVDPVPCAQAVSATADTAVLGAAIVELAAQIAIVAGAVGAVLPPPASPFLRALAEPPEQE